MKKIFLLLVPIILLMAGCGNSSGDKKVIIGIDDEFPPLAFHNEQGELIGFDVDLAKEAFDRMNVEVEFKPIDWDKKRKEITSGKIDLIWNGLDITEDRKEYMIFTRSYMDDRQILLVRKGDDQGIHSEGDLEGKIVGVQSGSTSSCYLKKNENLKNSLGGYKTYLKFTEVLDALKNGEINVLICDELIARYEMNRNPDQFQLIDVRIGSIAEMAVGFPKDKAELRDKVQEVFDEMVKDGTAKKISDNWFHADLIKLQK